MKCLNKIFIMTLLIVIVGNLFAMAQTGTINIWEGTGTNSKVKLTPYLSEGDSNTAIIICPGGSYFWLDKDNEGKRVAEWLQANGISAFVLEYRVAGIPAFITHYRLLARGNRYPDMLHDLQRSIQILRENSSHYSINPQRIGVMGFSAGGHLSLLSGIMFDSDVFGITGIHTDVSLKPDFIASIYPVVSFSNKCSHKRSRRGIIGEGNSINSQMKDSLSVELHVRDDMPHTFLVNCIDDPIVDYRNSVLLDSAMNEHGASHEYIQFKTGGHGFGVNPQKTSKEAIGWKNKFLEWLKLL